MSRHELNGDSEPEGDGDEYRDEAVCRLSSALHNIVNYHVDEYDMSRAAVVGSLFLTTLRWGLEMIQGMDDEEDEDDDGEEERG